MPSTPNHHKPVILSEGPQPLFLRAVVEGSATKPVAALPPQPFPPQPSGGPFMRSLWRMSGEHQKPTQAQPPSRTLRKLRELCVKAFAVACFSLAAKAQNPKPNITDTDRSAPTITSYNLDAHLTPATSQIDIRARLTLRNDGLEPLNHIALQVSSTLTWQSASLILEEGAKKLDFDQHIFDTDADHTGKASEIIIALPTPLTRGQSVALDTFYSGTITADATRLERIGATHGQALNADWDAITPDSTALRGMGNVLWYPIASPQLFLGQGAELFDAIAKTRLREQAATISLRLSVAYTGDAPTAAYFCGRRQKLTPVSDTPDEPIAHATGVATATFAAEPLGFRTPSLFILPRAETLAAPLSTESTSLSSPAQASELLPAQATNNLLAIETDDDATIPALATSALHVAPLLQTWLGPRPLSALTVIDHPGQPFEDGPLLVAPAAVLAGSTAAPALLHSLTHAWIQTGHPWMDEGLAQFFSLLYTEQEQGRPAAIAQLHDLIQPLSIAEPDLSPTAKPGSNLVGQPIITSGAEIYFRRKAAAVWFMLRDIAGEEPLKLALETWRNRTPISNETEAQNAIAFETLLEKTSRKDLKWFFADWVLADRGLPDLTIVNVTPRQLPAGKGHDTGWLVATTVRNDGAAAVEVPVIARSATFSTTVRLRIPGFSSATARILTESAPTEVIVNDGGTPETVTSTHRVNVTVQQQ